MNDAMLDGDGFPDKVGVAYGENINDGYAVRFKGQICTPRWSAKGAAEIYLEMLQAGTIQPQYEK